MLRGMEIIADLKRVCGGDSHTLDEWTKGPVRNWLACLFVIVVGAGIYGFTIGIWRAPLQGLFAALKFPMLILLTTLGNALINGMLAQLLGLNVSFRQSALAILTSFALAGLILGALAPVALFVTHNTPALSSESRSVAHAVTLLMHVLMIAFAGIVANLRLFKLLCHISGTKTLARRVLVSWLAVNFLLGSQLAWNLRPFIGAPALEVQFLRPEAFKGSFYESVYYSARNVMRALAPENEKRREMP